MKSEIRNSRQDNASATEDTEITEESKDGIRASADYADLRRFKKKGESKKENVNRRKARGCQLSFPFLSSLLPFPSFFKICANLRNLRIEFLSKFLLCAYGVLLCGVFLLSTASAGDQAQWGQRFTRNMVSAETGLVDSFDPATGQNVKWVVPLGSETWSTPVVAQGRVFIGTNNERPRDPRHQGDRGVLLCLNEKDGSLLWQLVVPKLGADPYLDWPKAGICSPATVEGNRVYTVTNRGEVVCLDIEGQANGNDGPYQDEGRYMTANGRTSLVARGSTLVPRDANDDSGLIRDVTPLDADIIWLFDIPRQAGTWPHDGAHGSILIDGDFLYVNTCNGLDSAHKGIRCPDGPSLICLDKKTGRLLARDYEGIGPRIFHSTWSPPALGVVNGHKRIFFCGGDGVVYGFEPFRGEGVPPSNRGQDALATRSRSNKFGRATRRRPRQTRLLSTFFS